MRPPVSRHNLEHFKRAYVCESSSFSLNGPPRYILGDHFDHRTDCKPLIDLPLNLIQPAPKLAGELIAVLRMWHLDFLTSELAGGDSALSYRRRS